MPDDNLDIRTYSLAEVAEMVLPEMTKGVPWLCNDCGELSGCRVGRTWRLTRGDVEDLIERHRHIPSPRVDARPRRSDLPPGLTPTAHRRLMHGDT
ncbi:helix-turn-helix domain-containing protein [Mycobacterium numidiamassiliense]|uniref:helix-turn-helix domain-containing protein n=1 Tax=Mycobacterium numidiamassiliense TaxID=1841861 RepID=UPI0010553E74|nr:helix-turn-helix domain-containing protein [Mycobacterium numidiamassiliense]